MTTIHAVELQAPGKTGMLILGVPGTNGAQKFVDLGLYGDARQYLAELGYQDPVVGQVRVTGREFNSFRGLGDGVKLPSQAQLERDDAATIDHLERLNNSVNGNPRYRVHFRDGSSAVTQSDAQINYGIDNPEYRDVPLDITYTRAGRIAYVERRKG